MANTSADTWRSAKGAEIRPGDRVRTTDGTELTVSRIEPSFFGMDNMIALIEDTPERWFKRPVTVDADVEILTQPRTG
jgi:hypothetical protein